MASLEIKKAGVGRYSPTSNYDKCFIKQIVAAVEGGLSQAKVSREYGIPVPTLQGWMRKFGSPVYFQHKKKSVPSSVKSSIIRAIQAGRMTIKEAMVAHQIKSDHTIRDWLREEKRKNADLRVSNSLKVPKNKDVKKPLGADLPKDVKALQRQLEEAQLRIAALNTLIDVAEEQLNIDIRKKPGARQF